MGQLLSKMKMKMKFLLIAFFILSLSLSAYSKPPKWYSNFKQIELMISTRQEVEKLFNHPEITDVFDGYWSKNITYKLKDGELSVAYSQGRCSEIYLRAYDVEKDVVIGITLYLEKEVSYSKLGIDLSSFDKREISDLVGVFTFVNDNTGEWFNGTLQKLSEYKLFPSKNKEHLTCSATVK